MIDDLRLERIEAKFDSVGEALVALARLDEQMMSCGLLNHNKG